MKNNPFLLCFISLVFLITSCGKDGNATGNKVKVSSVKWHNFMDGVKLAKKQKKYILIDFYADWCHYCKIMDRETFSDISIVNELRNNFICIRLYMDKPGNGKILFQKHTFTAQDFSGVLGITGLPTLVFMDSKKNLITKIPGFIKKEALMPMLKYIRDGCYLKNISFKDYKEGRVSCKK